MPSTPALWHKSASLINQTRSATNLALDSYIEVPKAVDPHLRRWMLFVDGENFAIRAQEVAQRNVLSLTDGDYYKKDTFVWFPEHRATLNFTNTPSTPIPLQNHAVRAHYYTSLIGDDDAITSVKQTLWDRGFHPAVFKRVKGQAKSKGVDI